MPLPTLKQLAIKMPICQLQLDLLRDLFRQYCIHPVTNSLGLVGLLITSGTGQLLVSPAALALGSGTTPTLTETLTGPIDYVVTGGTLRTQSNSGNFCDVGNSNTAALSGIPAGAEIEKAILFWTGSGATDNQVTLTSPLAGTNNISVPTGDMLIVNADFPPETYFHGTADITGIVQTQGNGNYTFSNLTVATGAEYCTFATVLSGWSMVVFYSDASISRNNVFQLYNGFHSSQRGGFDFTLDNILVSSDPVSSFTTFIWEGDPDLGGTSGGFTESLRFEGSLLSDSFNPSTNPYNSSSGILNSSASYGVDLERFDVSALTTPGATQINARVESGQDYVFLSTVILGVSTRAADLEVVEAVSNATPTVGEQITYTITVENKGTDDTTGVQVANSLPGEVTYISDDSSGSYNSTTGVWTVGNLAVNETRTLNITVAVNSAGTFSDSAQVTASSLNDPDSTPNNNDTSEDDQDSVSITATAAPTSLVSAPICNPDEAFIAWDGGIPAGGSLVGTSTNLEGDQVTWTSSSSSGSFASGRPIYTEDTNHLRVTHGGGMSDLEMAFDVPTEDLFLEVADLLNGSERVRITGYSGATAVYPQFVELFRGATIGGTNNNEVFDVDGDSTDQAAARYTFPTAVDRVVIENIGTQSYVIYRLYNCQSDFGDAPTSYNTLFANDGARHKVTPNIRLGATVNEDTNGFGDGTDDNLNATDDTDDGVQLNSATLQGQSLTQGDTVNLGITTAGTGVLNAWIDWNGDGDFGDAGEQIATNADVSGGTLSVPVPAGAQVGTTYARFRYSSESGLAPTGLASDGEVEDYQVTISASVIGISGNLYVDSNGNDLYEDSAGGGSEAALPENITVRLLSSDGTTELATTLTDINGFYSFPNLAPGTYQVAVETTDPDIPVGLDIGTTTPLTIVATSADATDQDFGFDLMTTGAGVSFCESPNGEVYSGGISNDIYGIYPPTGATFRITSSALARVVNSLATDHLNRVVYYAEGQAIYAWDPINDTHVRLRDSSGNLNVSSMLGGANISSLSSGGAAFYNGALYLGIEIGAFPPSNSDTEVYRVDFVPGSNGLTIQSLTVIGVNDNTGGANGALDNADWGDMIISDTGILYGATRFVGSGSGSFWSFDLNTSIYSLISNNYLGQLAKDGDGTLWGLSDTGRIQRVDVNTGSLFGPSSPTSTAIADMGECVVGFSTIGDRVWDDLDGDGVQDTLEPGIANVTVGLYRDLTGNGVIDGSDPLLTTQVTNASGNYDFVDLIPGTYIIRILEGTADDLDGTNVLDGSVLTTTSSTPGGQQAVNLPLGIVDYDDADFGYQLPVIPQNPNVLLVKRITQINNDTASSGGDDLAGYINQDDVTNPYDDNDITVADPVDPTDPPKDTDQWPDPTTNLIGGIDGGNVMPNDEIEYTIYYLSSGDATAESVLFCDYVPTFTSFTPNGYNGSAPQATGGIGGADLSIELFRNGSTDYHTGANDGDSATYFAPGADPATSFPGIDCDGDGDGINANTNGAVVVNLGDLPDATTDATGAYGYVRFRTRVK